MKKIMLIALLFNSVLLMSQTKNVFVFKIGAEIDPRTNRLSKLALEEATKTKADIVILKLNTYGGIIVDADSIRQRIIDYPKPIYVFIDKNAASAGALISISADSIYMAEGSTIGAATAVHQDGTKASEKMQSYMKGMMRSSAETSGRNPDIAQAMVDESILIDSVIEEGKLLVFTTSEAIENGFCEGQVSSVEEILKKQGIKDYKITNYELSLNERIISLFLNPFISGILIMIIIGGIYFELRTPGVGFPLAASGIAAVLYFIPLYLNGLAAHWEIALFVIGISLIGIEVFVIPGFGIAGVSGIIVTLIALFLVMINNDLFDFTLVAPSEMFKSILVIIFSMVCTLALVIFGGLGLAQSKVFSKITLQKSISNKDGYTSSFNSESKTLIGEKGIVFQDLRPSGKIKIKNQTYNAESRGEYLEKGTEIEVLKEDTNVLIVKKS